MSDITILIWILGIWFSSVLLFGSLGIYYEDIDRGLSARLWKVTKLATVIMAMSAIFITVISGEKVDSEFSLKSAFCIPDTDYGIPKNCVMFCTF